MNPEDPALHTTAEPAPPPSAAPHDRLAKIADLLDEPGYRPWCRYRPATGTGTAPDFPPARPRPLDRREIA